jgi:predicted lipid-binding transport protein (Tim44 family)/intein/homing endonuclease
VPRLRHLAFCLALCLAALPGGSAFARGGGGCLEAGTLVLTPAGPVAVEKLSPGDQVLAWIDGQLRPATVLARIEVRPETVLELDAGGRVLRVTGEHPVALAGHEGAFRLAAELRAGDQVRVWDGARLTEAALRSVRTVPAGRPAYDLAVSPGGNFLAGGVLVHNKGCFLPDAPVLRADGTEVAIRDVKPGERLMAFTPRGELTAATVQEVLVHQVQEYLLVKTASAELRVTGEHPFFVGRGTFRTIESLRPGDRIFVFDRRGMRPEPILSLARVAGRTTVYNLRTDEPNTFFAWGAAVHNKGGCLEAGTPVRTSAGAVAVERLAPGDPVLSWVGGRLQAARVQAVGRVEPQEYLELSFDGGALRVTPEHPLATGPEPGVYRTASSLGAGELIWRGDGPTLVAAKLLSVRWVKAERPAFNLMISPGGNFLAGGVLVHNKGCFLPDAPVLRADGTEVAIRDVKPGERLMAFTPRGELTAATVQEVLVHQVQEYLLVKTASAELRVTGEHPFFVGRGTFRTIESLRPGDRIFVFDRRGMRPEPILSLARVAGRTTVYNLRTDEPNTFFAWGAAVHNKGGGCLEAGTKVRTPNGAVAVEKLAVGDEVLSRVDGRLGPAKVQAVYRVEPREYVELAFDGGALRVTPEHPLAVGPEPGVYRAAADLKAGELLWRQDGSTLVAAELLSVRWAMAERPAFNLMISPGGNFLAGGVLVHNKGCFLPDAPVLRADGTELAIRDVKPGERLMAFTPRGELTAATVQEVLVHQVQEYLLVKTASAELRVTGEHPFFVGDGTFRTIESLRPGDRIFVFDGRGLRAEPILDVARVPGRVTVYNLRTASPNTFFAWGAAVHNKGGFSGGHSSGGGSDDPTPFFIFLGVVAAFIIIVVIVKSRSGGSDRENQDLDFCYSAANVFGKEKKTRALIDFIAQQDATFTHDALAGVARSTFLKLQECWERREYEPMKPLLMDALYRQHLAQIAGMVRSHEIDVIAQLAVERVDLVHVRYTSKPEQRTFTALITAKARDYYVDDRTRRFLRGDASAARFQEFWTFQLQAGRWLLREIEQTRESDALKDENFFEAFTAEGLKGIYAGKGADAAAVGPAGPWLEKGVERKADRIEKLLAFLAQTDRLWNRETMLQRARQVFIEVYTARESGDPAQTPADELFPAVAASLREEIKRQSAAGVSLQFRNLCIRKVELLLVRNFADNSRDEFTVRISSHAQRCHARQGQVMVADDYVRPFDEYWTFGRLDNQWKLKEVLPPARAMKAVDQENLDQDSSPEQLMWYYRQERAN